MRLTFRQTESSSPESSPSAVRRGRAATILLVLSLILPLSLYVGHAARLIGAGVGFQYDEALWVEPAVFLLRGGGVPPFAHAPGSWITILGRNWPLMVIPYEGTLKAFVALPLFAVFGISAEVARYSCVLLGSLGIAGLVTLLGIEVSPVAGLIVGSILAIHPSYLDLTVFDNGGVSVWMGAMGLMALALTNHLRRGSRLSAFLLGAAAGLGVWGRANVLWLIASAIVAALVAFGRRAVPKRDHIVSMTIGGCCGALPLILYEATSRLATLRFIRYARHPLSAARVAQRLWASAELMISDGFQRAIWAGPPLPSWQIVLGAALLGVVLLCLFVRVSSRNPVISRWRGAFAMSVVVLALIMVTSWLAIDQHHLVAVLPLALAAVAILGVEVVSRFRLAVLPLAIAGAGLGMLYLGWDVRIDRGLHQTRGKRVWSSAIYDVAEYLTSHPVAPERLKILNWGFQNSLYVISGGSVYGSELFWNATKTHSPRGITWESEVHDGGSFLLLDFRTVFFSSAADGFREALEKYGGPRREQRFLDRSGSPVAVLIEVKPAEPGMATGGSRGSERPGERTGF